MQPPRPLLLLLLPALLTFDASATIRYVDLNSPNPTPPYTNWPTAATNIQDAVDVATPSDQIFVTNGVYQTGGRVVHGSLTNRVAVTKPITVQSVNGPGVTAIQGYQVPGATNGDAAVRCVYLTNQATLVGFALAGGATRTSGEAVWDQNGGGAWCESTNSVVANCLVTSNAAFSTGGGVFLGTVNNCTLAYNSSSQGGGAFGYAPVVPCILNNCKLIANSAHRSGGGASYCTLNNCTVCSNSAYGGGGVEYSALNNCVVYYNGATVEKNVAASTMNFCCTFPLFSPYGANFTNAPLFVNLAGGDFHLQSNSPCINAGNNAYVAPGFDLDGNPRISGGTVDIGAYELQSPSSILSYAWAQLYGISTDGSADFADADGDGMNNWQEWIAGTDPTNALSVLKMFSPSNNAPGLKVSWQSVSGKTYFLRRATNLAAQPAFSALQSNLAGQVGTTIYTDTTATNPGPYFYRVGVQ